MLCRVLLEETLGAWLAARPNLAHPARERIGVYVGCMYHEYLSATAAASGGKPPPQVCVHAPPSAGVQQASCSGPQRHRPLLLQAFVGNGAPYMCGRVSYTFGFSGEAQMRGVFAERSGWVEGVASC